MEQKTEPTSQMKGKGKTRTQHEMDAKERASRAMRLRAMRVPYDQIAKELGYANRSSAFNAVQRALAEIPREAAKELRIAELESLDIAESALAKRLAQGELQAIDRMIRIKDMRAKLTGLYEEANSTGVDEVKNVLADWLASVKEEDATTSEQ